MNIGRDYEVLVEADTWGHPGITAPASFVQPNMESVTAQSGRPVKSPGLYCSQRCIYDVPTLQFHPLSFAFRSLIRHFISTNNLVAGVGVEPTIWSL